MNERIRELAEQAGGGPSKWYTDPDVLEKFAELIVQKCADIGEQYADGNYEVRNQILSHFGVEE
jgi:hypothetical protein